MQELYDAFAHSLSSDPELRRNAEDQLSSALHSDFVGVASSVLDAMQSVQGTDPVALSAIVYLKNAIYSQWLTCPIDPEGRSRILTRTLEVLPHVCQLAIEKPTPGMQFGILDNLSSIVGFLLSCEDGWRTTIPQTIREFLSTPEQQQQRVLAGTICIIELLRHFRWRLHLAESRAQKSALIEEFFPQLVQIVNSPAAHNVVVWKIFKAYKLAISGELPEFLQQNSQLEQWMTSFLSAITSREGKAKKWGLNSIHRLLQFAVVSMGTFAIYRYEEFAQRFTTQFAPETCRVYCNIASATVTATATTSELQGDDNSLTDRYLLQFFTDGLQLAPVAPIILQDLDVVLSIAFNSLQLSEDDIMDFDSSIDDFIYRQFAVGDDVDDFNLTAHSSARSFIDRLAIHWGQQVINFAQQRMSDAVTRETEEERVVWSDAALQLMHPLASSAFPAALDILSSTSPILASRACYLLSLSAEHLPDDTLRDATSRVIHIIMNDNSSKFVLSFEAAQAIYAVLKTQSDVVISLIQPNCIPIMQALIQLYNRTDLSCTEHLGDIVSRFVDSFRTELIPHSFQLVARLGTQCIEMINGLDDTSDESQVEAVRSMCSTINSIILAASSESSSRPQFMSVIAPIVSVIFTNREIDLYGDAVDMVINLCSAYQSVDESLWALFDQSIVAAFKEDPESCVDDAVDCISAFGHYTTDFQPHDSAFQVLANSINGNSNSRAKASIECQIMVLYGNYVERFLDAIKTSSILINPDIIRVLRCIIIREPGLGTDETILGSLMCEPNQSSRDAKIISIAILRVLLAGIVDDEICCKLFGGLMDNINVALHGHAALQISQDTGAEQGMFVNESAKYFSGSKTHWIEEEDAQRLDAIISTFNLREMYKTFISSLGEDKHRALVNALSVQQSNTHTELTPVII